MNRTHRLAAIALFLGLCAAPAGTYAAENTSNVDLGEKVPGAERLEGRLLAPCCWTQTLDIHGSEIANALRREIRARLKAGESSNAIEASLVARYGEKIRAVPDGVPLDKMGGIGWLGVASAAAFIGVVLWRWRQRGQANVARGNQSPGEKAVTASEATDERLESELKRFDDS